MQAVNVIARSGAITVLEACQAISWSTTGAMHVVQLHQVDTPSVDNKFLRALRIGSLWVVVDLRTLERGLAADIPPAPARDVEGLISHALRTRFANAEALLAKAEANCRAIWTAGDATPTTRRPARIPALFSAPSYQ